MELQLFNDWRDHIWLLVIAVCLAFVIRRSLKLECKTSHKPGCESLYDRRLPCTCGRQYTKKEACANADYYRSPTNSVADILKMRTNPQPHKKWKLLIVVMFIALSVSSAHAQSARRVFLLCLQEDPSCWNLLEQANKDYLADPSIMIGDVKYKCYITRENANNLSRTRYLFMQVVSQYSSVVDDWEPRDVIHLTYSLMGRGPECKG